MQSHTPTYFGPRFGVEHGLNDTGAIIPDRYVATLYHADGRIADQAKERLSFGEAFVNAQKWAKECKDAIE